MESEFIPLPELAKEAGVTLNQVRHWISALGVEVVMVGRVRHVNQDGAGRLKEMASLVASGKSPKEAAALVASKPEQAHIMPEPTTALASPAPDVAARLDGIERSIMALVESHRQAIEAHGREAAAIRAEVSRLVEENRALRLRLEPPPEPARQIKAWSPDPRPDPAAGHPWWRVAWLSLVAPERLRRSEW